MVAGIIKGLQVVDSICDRCQRFVVSTCDLCRLSVHGDRNLLKIRRSDLKCQAVPDYQSIIFKDKGIYRGRFDQI